MPIYIYIYVHIHIDRSPARAAGAADGRAGAVAGGPRAEGPGRLLII